jgi:hypothetical protein
MAENNVKQTTRKDKLLIDGIAFYLGAIVMVSMFLISMEGLGSCLSLIYINRVPFYIGSALLMVALVIGIRRGTYIILAVVPAFMIIAGSMISIFPKAFLIMESDLAFFKSELVPWLFAVISASTCCACSSLDRCNAN